MCRLEYVQLNIWCWAMVFAHNGPRHMSNPKYIDRKHMHFKWFSSLITTIIITYYALFAGFCRLNYTCEYFKRKNTNITRKPGFGNLLTVYARQTDPVDNCTEQTHLSVQKSRFVITRLPHILTLRHQGKLQGAFHENIPFEFMTICSLPAVRFCSLLCIALNYFMK